jgi:ankyrin repeat protein
MAFPILARNRKLIFAAAALVALLAICLRQAIQKNHLQPQSYRQIVVGKPTSARSAAHRPPAILEVFMDANADDARAMLEHGAKVDMRDADGNTALFRADSLKAVTLLNAHAKIEARNKLGQTPLILNCAEGNNDAVLVLLARYANVNARDNNGTTPILAAAAHCRLETIKALVHAGADTRSRKKDGTTTLMYSLYNKDERVFPWFLSRSSNLNAHGMGDNTALSIAKQLQQQAQAVGDPTDRYDMAIRELSKGASGH